MKKRPERLSPTKICMFLTKYKEWYKYVVLGEEQPDNVYFAVGHALHGFLEDFFNDNPSEVDNLSSYTTRKFGEVWQVHFDSNDRLQKFLAEDDAPYTIDDLMYYLERYIRVWLEETKRTESKYGTQKAYEYNRPDHREMELKNKELKLFGIADAVITTDKWNRKSKHIKFTIVDYKTSSKSQMTLPTEYYMQMMVYALMHGKTDWVAVDYLKYNQKYFFRVTPEALDKTKNMVESVWNEVNYIFDEVEKGNDMSEYKPKFRIGDFI